MTPEQLAAIRERVEKASPGPWLERTDRDYYQGGTYIGTGPYSYGDGGKKVEPDGDDVLFENDIFQMHGSDEDKDFIVNARQDIPALLSYVEELEKVMQEVSEASDDMDEYGWRSFPRLRAAAIVLSKSRAQAKPR